MKTVQIPTAILAIDGTKPAAGDPIDLTVTGKVAAINGELAEVEIESINGQPLPDEAGEPADQTDDSMRAMAEEADAKGLPMGSP